MIESLKQWALERGVSLQVVPVQRVEDLRKEIRAFQENEDLNGFQKWITNDLYRLDLPEMEFPIRAVIILAIPHPFYATVEFARGGKTYNFLSLVRSDFEDVEKGLRDFLAAKNLQICPAANLPLKRLAVQSGLAVYGRNNICFIEGMGSLFSLAAYYSNVVCESDDWREVRQAERCAKCLACLHNCPTGAIRKERFLINNEICLSNLNESPGEFPTWLPGSVHHCLYDCLKCQIICPLNKEYLSQTIGPIQFSEAETEMLLSGSPLDAFPFGFQEKSKMLGLDEWFENIPRNLKALFAISDPPSVG